MKIGLDLRMSQWTKEFFGISRYTKELIDHLFKIDQENEYVLFFDENFNKEEYENFSSPRKNIKKKLIRAKYYSLREQLTFPFDLLKENLDLVHFPHFNLPILYPKTSVVTILDLIHFHSLVKTNIISKNAYHLVVNSAVRKTKKIITISEATKKDIIKHLRINPDKIEVIYLGIGDQFRKITDQKKLEQIREKYNLKKPFIFFLGAWKRHKNIENLISAFELLREHYGFKEEELVLGGKEDPKYPEIREKILKSSSKEAIKILGSIPDKDLPLFYNLADFFIVPSFIEGFGLIGLEAMACGTPVISSKTSCLPEIYQQAAEYFDPYNIEEMAEKMTRVLKNKNLQKELIERGFQRIKEFSWQKCARKTLEIYKNSIFN